MMGTIHCFNALRNFAIPDCRLPGKTENKIILHNQ
jgi:hypothetical protein